MAIHALGKSWFLAGLVFFFLAGDPSSAETDRKENEGKIKAEALEEKASSGEKGKPPAKESITGTEAQAVDPKGKEPLDDPLTCLARTIYWEAKGEGDEAMQAVANVVMNRLEHEGFPKTICAVVKQGRERGSCQFSWWCDGRPDKANETEAYAHAKEVARRVLNRQLGDVTHGALYFHDQSVSPDRAKEYTRTATIGKHIFYKAK